MARGTQFLALLDQLRSELGQSANPSHGLNTASSYKYKLNATQEWLYRDHGWSFLRGPYDVETQAGESLYDLPVDQSTITKVEFKWDDSWEPLSWGIGGIEYSEQDSDEDERSDPVQKIDLRQDSQFEVWPIPATDGNTIRFWGREAYRPLVNDSDTAMLDDRLIVLFTAANLAPKEQYQRKLTEANTYYNTMKKAARKPSRGFILGGGQGGIDLRPGRVRVAEANRSGA
jgi:hypothetical protein